VVFSTKTNGDIGDDLLAIIDWQLARAGSCMDDIAMVALQNCELFFQLNIFKK
jgi:thiamine kinase-like enzyme